MSNTDKQGTPVDGKTLEAEKSFLVTMRGDIDVFSFQRLREFFQDWKEKQEEPNLLVDLSAVNYMGSSGWALLFSQNHIAKRREGHVVIFGLSPRLNRSLSMISGNRELLKVADDLDEAKRALKEMSQTKAA